MASRCESVSSRTATRSPWGRPRSDSRPRDRQAVSVFLTSLDNQNLLRALEILVVALIWLFFFRVIRAVWVQVRPPPARGAAAQGPAGAQGSRPAQERRGRA